MHSRGHCISWRRRQSRVSKRTKADETSVDQLPPLWGTTRSLLETLFRAARAVISILYWREQHVILPKRSLLSERQKQGNSTGKSRSWRLQNVVLPKQMLLKTLRTTWWMTPTHNSNYPQLFRNTIILSLKVVAMAKSPSWSRWHVGFVWQWRTCPGNSGKFRKH